MTITPIAAGVIIWSLWVRRDTWNCKWQTATTLSILLQGVAIFLTSPIASWMIGTPLYERTGVANLDDFAGHGIYLWAMACIVYNTVGRLADDEELRLRFKQHIELPFTIIGPLLLATFLLSNGRNEESGHLPEMAEDFWLHIYWILLCGSITYLLGYGCRALLVLRRDPDQRITANIYLAACLGGIIGCVLKVCPGVDSCLARAFTCLCAIAFAVTAARVWAFDSRPIKMPEMA